MNKFKFEIEIEERTEENALTKLRAASVLMKRLTPVELAKLADVVKNDPVKTALAKKYLGL